MKIFFKKVLGNFIIILTLLIVTFIYSYNKYIGTRVPIIKYNLFNKYHNQMNGADTVSIVLGSSHSFYGIDTKFLNGNVFNFASISQSLMEDYYILKHVKNPINQVVLPIDFFSNWHYLNKTSIGGEKLRIIDYRVAYGNNYPFTIDCKDLVNFLSELSKNFYNTGFDSFDNKGNIIGNCVIRFNKISDAKSAYKRHNVGRNFKEINPYLDSINLLCVRKKIQLFIISMPVSQEYLKYTNIDEFNKFIFGIKKKYNNIFIMDFRDYFKLSDEELMFRDADHLSICGRNIFSKFLNEKINCNKN